MFVCVCIALLFKGQIKFETLVFKYSIKERPSVRTSNRNQQPVSSCGGLTPLGIEAPRHSLTPHLQKDRRKNEKKKKIID